MKEYKYTINGNKYEVVVGDITDNIATLTVNGEEYTVEMEKQPEPEKKKPVVKAATAANDAPAASKAAVNKANAVKDVNEIRKHRMTANVDAHLYTEADVTGDPVDFVLKEKRVEFAFEAHRFFDLMRNDKDIVRDFWGYHTNYTAGQSTSGKPGLDAVPRHDDTRLVFPIPSKEIDNNPLCEQNPGY